MTLLKTASIAGMCLSVSACATITRGTTEDVTIQTTPDDVTVVTSLNHTCNTNPCVVKVPRKESFTVTASKPGYGPQTVAVGTKVTGNGAAGIAGNVLVGGVVGIGVDAATGAGRDHFPNPVVINLRPVGSPAEAELKPVSKPKKGKPVS